LKEEKQTRCVLGMPGKDCPGFMALRRISVRASNWGDRNSGKTSQGSPEKRQPEQELKESAEGSPTILRWALIGVCAYTRVDSYPGPEKTTQKNKKEHFLGLT
jgi:hypothetical protein